MEHGEVEGRDSVARGFGPRGEQVGVEGLRGDRCSKRRDRGDAVKEQRDGGWIMMSGWMAAFASIIPGGIMRHLFVKRRVVE